ncbi:TPA: hypothetical protein MCM29_005186 [Klebsiella pneumoniae]|nr:hypothetical protein [Klebsiella pneumoniae]HBT8980446.1 hypothetical protein [Klebsiella pneumoniae]
MKFFYLKHTLSGMIVVADFDSNEDGEWVNLSLGREGEQPYFNSKEELSKILRGEMNDSWSYEIPSSLKRDIAMEALELCEVDL